MLCFPRLCSLWCSKHTTVIFLICALLGYYTAHSGNSLRTFRDNLSVPSSGVKQKCWGWNLSQCYVFRLGFSGTIGSLCRSTLVPPVQCHSTSPPYSCFYLSTASAVLSSHLTASLNKTLVTVICTYARICNIQWSLGSPDPQEVRTT